jgi:uncharacterized protein YdaU (DUF1376 family)
VSRPWFKFFTRDFRDGVRRMTSEQIGVYVMVLSLMYERPSGKLPDQDRDICNEANLSLRVWRRVRGELLSLGKLAVEDGFLVNSRVSQEVSFAEVLRKKRQSFGQTGGLISGKSRRKANENNTEPEANASLLLHPETQRHRDTEQIDKSICERAGARKPKSKSARIATDSTLPAALTLAMLEAATARGLEASAPAEFAKWRDYHLSRGTKIADHEASFRTWLGNVIAFRRPITPSASRPAIYPNPYRG